MGHCMCIHKWYPNGEVKFKPWNYGHSLTDFIKNVYEDREDLALAAGDRRRRFFGCLYTLSIFRLYNACRVTGHSPFLIRNIIYKHSVGLGSAPARRLYEATNTAPRITANGIAKLGE